MLIAFLQNAILYMDFLYLIEIEISRRADDTVYKIFQDPTATEAGANDCANQQTNIIRVSSDVGRGKG